MLLTEKSKFLYLPVEVKPRELDSKLLIASEACHRGFKVIIGTKDLNSILDKSPKGIYFYKDASPSAEKWFLKLNSMGYSIVVHDEEGLVTSSDNEYLEQRVLSKNLNNLKVFFCWGSHQEKLIKHAKEIFKSNLEVIASGHPRFDLLQSPLKTYNSPNVKRSKKLILINTKLAAANHIKGDSGWLEILKKHNQLQTEEALLNRLEHMEYSRKLLTNYVKLIESLNKSFPQVDIIIRPHPSEDVKIWNDIAAPLCNVTVTREHNIGYWLNRCDLVIHTGCTTGLEAFALDIPVVAFRPTCDERFDLSLPNDISHNSSNISECIYLIEELFNKKDKYKRKNPEFKSILKEHVENIGNPNAFRTIVDSLDNISVKEKDISKFQIYYWNFRSFISSLKNSLITKKNNSKNDIEYDEIKDPLESICYLLRYKVPKITKLKKNVYLLERSQ